MRTLRCGKLLSVRMSWDKHIINAYWNALLGTLFSIQLIDRFIWFADPRTHAIQIVNGINQWRIKTEEKRHTQKITLQHLFLTFFRLLLLSGRFIYSGTQNKNDTAIQLGVRPPEMVNNTFVAFWKILKIMCGPTKIKATMSTQRTHHVCLCILHHSHQNSMGFLKNWTCLKDNWEKNKKKRGTHQH